MRESRYRGALKALLKALDNHNLTLAILTANSALRESDEKTTEETENQKPDGLGEEDANSPRQEAVSEEEMEGNERELSNSTAKRLLDIIRWIELNGATVSKEILSEHCHEAERLLLNHLPVRKKEALRVLTSMSINPSWQPRNREIMQWALRKINKALQRDERWEELEAALPLLPNRFENSSATWDFREGFKTAIDEVIAIIRNAKTGNRKDDDIPF